MKLIVSSSRVVTFSFLLLGIMAFSGCSTFSALENHWFDPTYRGEYTKFKKVLVIAFVSSESTRRTAEAEFSRALGEANSVPSFTYRIDIKALSNGEMVKTELVDKGFDAAVVLRFMDKEREERWIPSSMNQAQLIQPMAMTPFGLQPIDPWMMQGFAPMWSWGVTTWNDPGRTVVDKTYIYETNVYDLKSDKLIWSAITTTMNPSGFADKIESIARAIMRQMKRDGLYEIEKKQ